jgi:hypothetical protein
MYAILLNTTPEECIECVEKGTEGDFSHMIVCGLTLVITAVIRAVEKRRLEKRLKK